MKKILLEAYHFPPDAAVGTLRMAKFVTFLPDFGWEPIILTVKGKYCDVLTGLRWTLKSYPPKLIRTAMFRRPTYYFRKLKRSLLLDHVNSDVSQSHGSAKTRNSRMSFRQRINFLLSFPDEHAGWLPFALINGIELIRQEVIAILMTSGRPHSVHLIGACLSKLSRIP